MTRFVQKLGKLLSLTPRQHAYLIIAVGYLARARIAFGTAPAKEILARLQDGPETAADDHGALDVELLRWAIRAAADAVPWRADCLIQSMAADRWLRRHGIVPAFKLGIKADDHGAMLGHAWLEVDGEVVTGGAAVEDYKRLIG